MDDDPIWVRESLAHENVFVVVVPWEQLFKKFRIDHSRLVEDNEPVGSRMVDFQKLFEKVHVSPSTVDIVKVFVELENQRIFHSMLEQSVVQSSVGDSAEVLWNISSQVNKRR